MGDQVIAGVGLRMRINLDRLEELKKELRPRAKQLIRAAAFEVQGKAQVNAPVDTGALKNSIEATEVGIYTWWVIVGVDYGAFVELGTSRMAAQPYLTPAVEEVAPIYRAHWAELFA